MPTDKVGARQPAPARYRGAVPLDFPDLLRSHLTAKGLSQRDFAARAGLNKGFLHGLLVGSKVPPMDRIQAMADALGLSAKEREEFELVAGLEHSPEPVARFVSRVLESQAVKKKSPKQ